MRRGRVVIIVLYSLMEDEAYFVMTQLKFSSLNVNLTYFQSNVDSNFDSCYQYFISFIWQTKKSDPLKWRLNIKAWENILQINLKKISSRIETHQRHGWNWTINVSENIKDISERRDRFTSVETLLKIDFMYYMKHATMKHTLVKMIADFLSVAFFHLSVSK